MSESVEKSKPIVPSMIVYSRIIRIDQLGASFRWLYGKSQKQLISCIPVPATHTLSRAPISGATCAAGRYCRHGKTSSSARDSRSSNITIVAQSALPPARSRNPAALRLNLISHAMTQTLGLFRGDIELHGIPRRGHALETFCRSTTAGASPRHFVIALADMNNNKELGRKFCFFFFFEM